MKHTIAARVCSLISAICISLFLIPHTNAQEKTLTVYSYRDPVLMAPLYEAFKAKTGIAVNHIFAKDGLEERIQLEGTASPADVILTVDVAKLVKAKTIGITQNFNDPEITKVVPAQFRDGDGAWMAVSTRARLIYASKTRVSAENLRYEDLANPEFKGKICVRSGLHPYNLSLISSMIANTGLAATETWLAGVKANLARKPSGGDREQAQAIMNGVCDIALGNSYYVALMQTNTKDVVQQEWANAIKVIMPNAQDRGTHVNISGAAIAKNAPNLVHAKAFMQFLVSPAAQKLYADSVYEYPIRADVPVNPVIAQLGVLKADPLPITKISAHIIEAAKLVEKVGFDQ